MAKTAAAADDDDDLFAHAAGKQPGPSPKTRADQIYARFKKFHRDNPRIWRLYQKYAFEVINRGRESYSSDCIFHRIRWHISIETTTDDGLKLNDHYTVWYARMFEAVHPAHAGFFNRRRQPSESQPAHDTPISVFITGTPSTSPELEIELRKLGTDAI